MCAHSKEGLQVKGREAGTTHQKKQTRGSNSKHLRKARGSTARVCVCCSLSMAVAAQRLSLCFQPCWFYFLNSALTRSMHPFIHPPHPHTSPSKRPPSPPIRSKKGQNARQRSTWWKSSLRVGFYSRTHLCTVIVITWWLIYEGYSRLGSRGPSTVTFMARW